MDIRGKNEYPSPRCFHTSNYDKYLDCIIIYGGWNGNISQSNSSNFTNLWKFDIKGNLLKII